MDKNTVWAIVLSTLVLVFSGVFLPKIMGKNKEPVAQSQVRTEAVNSTDTIKTAGEEENLPASAENQEETAVEETEEEEPEVAEEIINFKTKVADIQFTTKGGDIISYKLLGEKNIDKDTNEGVQVSDNVSSFNRTLGVSLGTAESPLIDKVFNYEWLNENTILFKKNLKVTDAYGKENTVILGKKYTFIPEEYMFKLEIMIHSDNAAGLNFDGVSYTLRTSPQIGPHYDPKHNKYDTRQFIAFNGKKIAGRRGGIMLTQGQYKRHDTKGKALLWAGIGSKYFEELIIPTDNTIWSGAIYSSKIEQNNYSNAQALFERRSFSGTDIQDSYYVYFGPRNDKDLKIYNVADNNGWKFSGYKLTESLTSGGLTGWIEVALKWCLEMIHKVVPNWGVCIIILTILLKLCLFPMSKKQSMSTLKMQELQPQIQKVQEKYKDDQQKQQQEMQKIYKEANYNPASGCLPLILQFFILFAMYQLFNNYFDFRGAEFIPGWIPDLSAGDAVWSWEKNIFLISGFTGNTLRILPIIYVASQIFFSLITQNGGATAGQNNASMKFMTYGLPILFFFLFYSAPAGLLIYWITSNLFQMVQQLIINKIVNQKKQEMKTEPAKVQKTLPPKAKKNQKK